MDDETQINRLSLTWENGWWFSDGEADGLTDEQWEALRRLRIE